MISSLLDEASADRNSMRPLTPFTNSETPASNRKAVPALGENTEEILIEMLGYTWDDIVELKN